MNRNTPADTLSCHMPKHTAVSTSQASTTIYLLRILCPLDQLPPVTVPETTTKDGNPVHEIPNGCDEYADKTEGQDEHYYC